MMTKWSDPYKVLPISSINHLLTINKMVAHYASIYLFKQELLSVNVKMKKTHILLNKFDIYQHGGIEKCSRHKNLLYLWAA